MSTLRSTRNPPRSRPNPVPPTPPKRSSTLGVPSLSMSLVDTLRADRVNPRHDPLRSSLLAGVALRPPASRGTEITEDRHALPLPRERVLDELLPVVDIALRHGEDHFVVHHAPQVLRRSPVAVDQTQQRLTHDVPGGSLTHEGGRLRPRALRVAPHEATEAVVE